MSQFCTALDASLLCVCKPSPISQAGLVSHCNANFGRARRPQLGRKGKEGAPGGGGNRNSGLTIHATSTFSSSHTPESARRPFIEPVWLFPSRDGDEDPLGSISLNEETSKCSTSSASQFDKADAIYTIQLATSKDDRSGLSVPNAGIVLSLIGEHAEAIIQRLPPIEVVERPVNGMRFQRGSVDVLTFRGPNLGRLAALWVAPEAGTWRLEQVGVTILPCHRREEEADTDISAKSLESTYIEAPNEAVADKHQRGLFQFFKGSEMLLGDGVELQATELKPDYTLESEDISAAASILVEKGFGAPKSLQDSSQQREDGMKEYEALKVALLSSTAVMVAVGTAGLAVLGAPDMAQGFAAGGSGGFLYLLMLQRAVDELPASARVGKTAESGSDLRHQPDSPVDTAKIQNVGEVRKEERSISGKRNGVANGINLPVTRFALIVGVAFAFAKLAQGGAGSTLPPQQLLAGALGFFISKIAVFLAAFRPLSSIKHK